MEKINLGRVTSLTVLVGYSGMVSRGVMGPEVLALAVFGMLFIWFPSLARFFDQLKPGFTKTTTPLDPNTPPCVFVLIGWGIMLLPLLFLMVTALV